MTARTHDAFSIAFLLTAVVLYPPEHLTLATAGACLLATAIGALLPDLDQAGNVIWDVLPGGDWIGKLGRRIFYKHRTISHSLLGGFLLYKFLEWLFPKVLNGNFFDLHLLVVSVMIGFASHLFSDGLTKEGVPLLFPLHLDIGFPPFKFLRVRTGTWMEYIVVLPSVVFYSGWLVWQHYDVFRMIFRLVAQ